MKAVTNMSCDHIYEDAFGSVINHVDEGFIEIRWYDSTVKMTASDFQEWLLKFTDLVDETKAQFILAIATVKRGST